MKCPYCKKDNDKVVDTRATDGGLGIRRRRMCNDCGRRFTSHEKVEEINVLVLKKDASKEVFDIQKVLKSVKIACRKRPIDEEQIHQVAEEIECQAMEVESKEITSTQIGDIIMEQLKSLDHVAFVRFSSVYKEYDNVDQFISALKDLND
jgi:transcriptional repressor NrdR